MKSILFCGGGSAGHVIPNISLIEDLRDKYVVYYMGTDGIERDICNNFKVDFYQFDGVKLERGKIFKNLTIPFKLFKSIRQANKIIKKLNPDLVFCKGGYASLPPAICAKFNKIPVITHESDLSLGLANKIISTFAKTTLCSFAETAKGMKRGKYSGTPMRRSLFNVNKVKARENLKLDMRPTVLVFGGGSGSKKINESLRSIVAKLCKEYNVLHVCGKGNSVESEIYGYRQIEFAENMGDIYACADYTVARCGSNSAHEVLAMKIPTLFIPLENGSSRGDQIKNARYFESKGLCRVLKENNLSPHSLYDEIKKLIGDNKIKSALASTTYNRGNRFIINCIENELK